MRAPRTWDASVVLGSRPSADAPAVPVAGLEAQMDRWGVEVSLVRHADAVFYDAPTGNLRLVEELAGHPRLLPAFVLGPLDCGEHGGPDGLREHLDTHGARAVWLYPASHGWDVRGPEARTLLAALSTAGRPVLVDLEECGWGAVDVLAEALPEVDLVVCDIGYRTLRQAWAVMARHPRVHVDTSHLTAGGGLEEVVDRFGPHRVCFGSGTPVHDHAGALFHLAAAELDDSARTQVARGNLSALLGTPAEVPVADGTAAQAPDEEEVRTSWGAVGIVDAHAHVGRWPSSYVPRPGEDQLLRGMRLTGTSTSIVSSLRSIWTGEVAPGNDEVVALAERLPGRVYGCAVANPHRPGDRTHLEELASRPEVRGLKVHPHTHDCSLADARYDWVLDLAEAHGLPVLGHSFEGTWHSATRHFVEVAARRPGLVLVAGHAGATPHGFAAMAEHAPEVPNLVAELCGSRMTGWWVRRLVDAFGPARVLHGTDSTLIDPRHAVGRVLGADLTPTERDLVLAGNARRIFTLGTTHRRSA